MTVSAPTAGTATAAAAQQPWQSTATYPEPPPGWTGASKLEAFIDAMIDLGQTGQIFGEHGIGKTATFFSHIAEAYEDTELVYVPAANLTPDDLLANAPVRGEDGALVLCQLVMAQLRPGRRFVLLIDDSLQAGDTVQAQLMQVACNWTLGEYDLRELGCAGVFLTDNESLAETSARRSDLAILDRMTTLRITANDTAWRVKLARRYRDRDLSGVFAAWAALPKGVRELLSPRTLDHVLANAVEGFPPDWGLPLVNGERLRLQERLADGSPGADHTDQVLDRIADELGVARLTRIDDPVRRVLRAALRNRWTVLLQGPPGCGKTELVRELVRRELGRDPLYFSLPVTNVEDLCVPVPAADGSLRTLVARAFTGPEPKAIVWDEYNRPKDRGWITKRTLERMIKLYRRGLQMELGMIYLGDGEYAPVPLTALIERLENRPVVGLRELAADVPGWEQRLRRALQQSDEGTNDSDLVHQVIANAELSQLRKHQRAVARLVALLPPKLRSTYLIGVSEERQRYWIQTFQKLPR
jgi:hypothetical protein